MPTTPVARFSTTIEHTQHLPQLRKYARANSSARTHPGRLLPGEFIRVASWGTNSSGAKSPGTNPS
eukprot:7162258-Pyramimonas_sp.AAC.1